MGDSQSVAANPIAHVQHSSLTDVYRITIQKCRLMRTQINNITGPALAVIGALYGASAWATPFLGSDLASLRWRGWGKLS
jgi:uncharacterized membrane protein